jgi:hypothetical protein
MCEYYSGLIEYLKKINLTGDLINEIVGCFTVAKYNKGDYFTSINGSTDKIGFVVNGLFFMSTINPNGTLFTKEFIKNNQFLLAGYDPLKESTVNIQPIKDSIIIEAKYTDIQLLFNKYHNLEISSKKRIENEIESICERMSRYATIPAKERYILFKKEYGKIEADIPQYLVASYLGVTPTQLSRIRAKLMRENQHM